MVRQDSLFDPIEEKKQEQESRAQQAQEKAKKVEALEQELNDLKKQQRQEDFKILDHLLQDNRDLRDQCINVARENPLSTYKVTKTFDENFTTNVLFRSFLLSYVKRTYPEHFSETEAQYAPLIDDLEQNIASL